MVTSLTLKHYKGTIEALQEFFKWFHYLQHFKMVYTLQPTNIRPNLIATALLDHRHSLKTLTFGHDYGWNESLPEPIDVSRFTSLEMIQLNGWYMEPEWVPSHVCANILSAPRLKKFIWDSTAYDTLDDSYVPLDDESITWQGDWFVELVRLAHAQGRALREIVIIFGPPSSQHFYWRGGENVPKLLEEVRKEIEKLGVQLTFESRSFLTEEQVCMGD